MGCQIPKCTLSFFRFFIYCFFTSEKFQYNNWTIKFNNSFWWKLQIILKLVCDFEILNMEIIIRQNSQNFEHELVFFSRKKKLVLEIRQIVINWKKKKKNPKPLPTENLWNGQMLWYSVFIIGFTITCCPKKKNPYIILKIIR